ncbi:MAG: preprotein translocase subunit YajC [Candidatus Omnitrophica bacterium]|nr:preprotein translocase subunit YajC [Candidatus Omnitrophota bacterium]
MGNEQTINPIMALVPYALIFAVFYFLVIKPQKEKQKEQKLMLDNLKKNDEIVTSGGLHGTIVSLKESSVVVRIDDNVKVEIDRGAILRVQKN